MTAQHNKSTLTHTPEPWREEDGEEFGNILITDEQGVTIATCWQQPLDPLHWVKANARLIVNAPELLKALEDAFVLLDRISDTLHYEDGLPVTFLEARDIEIIYGDAVTELARFETLIREARGQK
jgi:hypothetical protein